MRQRLFAYGLLAVGFVDLVVEAQQQPYDYLALVPMVEGAGGMISDWQGKPLRPIKLVGIAIDDVTPGPADQR